MGTFCSRCQKRRKIERQPDGYKTSSSSSGNSKNNEEMQFSKSITKIEIKSQKPINNYFRPEDMAKINKLLAEDSKAPHQNIRINHYRRGNLIGQGSFGSVYEGLDEERGQIIAIKYIDKRKLTSLNISYKSIESEIEILSRLNHKNIVKYYNSNETDQHFKIFFEYCEGGSIARLLEKYRNFNACIIRKYLREMLEGLEYLHAHNIIHRDIKGANILVDRNGTCKLSDFGGAKILKEGVELQNTDTINGTPNWMAPEEIGEANKRSTTMFSDIWSVGCTVIEMATGTPPWSEIKNPMAVMFNIMKANSPPEIPKDIPMQLGNFISCCLRINPNERPNVTQLLKHPFLTEGTLQMHWRSPGLHNYHIKVKMDEEKGGLEKTSLSLFEEGSSGDHKKLIVLNDSMSGKS